ncbi:MAG: hypothetical protein H0W73_08520 [Bacteroidetes bacterium]|nr:hypothetical protein [Bacteroidota bacterium]
MKKSLLALSITLALFSCKKKETTSDFTATDVTGTSVVKGNVNKNVVTPNGNGGWINTNRVNMSGVVVTIKVNKGGAQGLYPNSTANGADVYTATTDANGNYAISVKSNASGVSALITIDGFTGTQDTVINGVTKTGLYATYAGTSVTRNLFMGQNTTFDHNFTATNVSSNPNSISIGSAIVTGSVSMNLVRKVTTGTVVAFSATNIAVPANTPIYLSFDKDPTLLNTKMYQSTTGANGTYTFNLSTVPVGTSGFNQDATIWVADWATSRDTMNFNGTTFINITPGVQGVYNKSTTTTNGVYSTEIRNAINLGYGAFTPN